ncbi:WD40-repeat-containing_domain superfamily [Hexamita inflata]|uniref:WD40-repeat-containing domain superfamily n=1 Tax=Hexamita inflata TaxID=28002 RepID=A0AA86QBN0_9EUKA|nr:WD40-repeat-containing domain superfamily [Hexamita inflata]
MCYSPADDLFAYSCEDKSLVILEIPSYSVKYSVKCRSFIRRIQFGSNSIECFNQENQQIRINLETGEETESSFQLQNQFEVNSITITASQNTSFVSGGKRSCQVDERIIRPEPGEIRFRGSEGAD